MAASLETYVVREKAQRDDVNAYIGDLLVRQRMANEAIVGFGEQFIPAGALVIDACAGPEGSYLASVKRHYRWIGNDISFKFAETLNHSGADVILSNFSKAPFRENCADAVFFILALNNICEPEEALEQAKRIIKPGGVVIEAEPGLSSSTGRVILSSILDEHPHLNGKYYSNKWNTSIAQQLQDKPYSKHEYVDMVLGKALGVTRTQLADELKDIIELSPDNKVYFRFQQKVVEIYFQKLEQARIAAGLTLVKAGIMVMSQSAESGDWVVSRPVPIPEDEWIKSVTEAKRWKVEESKLVQQLPRLFDRASKRIVMPVLCMKNEAPQGEQAK